MEELAAIDESQDKVQLLGRLKREFERNDKWVVDLSEHGTFGERVCHLRPRNDVCFAKGLQCVNTMGISFPVTNQFLSKAARNGQTAN